MPKSDGSFIDPEEEVEELDIDKLKVKQRKTKKKCGISAEAYGEYNKLKDFKPRVIEKSEEQKELIRGILK